MKKRDPNYIAKFKDSTRMSLIFTDFHYSNYIVAHWAVHFFAAFWKCCTLAQFVQKQMSAISSSGGFRGRPRRAPPYGPSE